MIEKEIDIPKAIDRWTDHEAQKPLHAGDYNSVVRLALVQFFSGGTEAKLILSAMMGGAETALERAKSMWPSGVYKRTICIPNILDRHVVRKAQEPVYKGDYSSVVCLALFLFFTRKKGKAIVPSAILGVEEADAELAEFEKELKKFRHLNLGENEAVWSAWLKKNVTGKDQNTRRKKIDAHFRYHITCSKLNRRVKKTAERSIDVDSQPSGKIYVRPKAAKIKADLARFQYAFSKMDPFTYKLLQRWLSEGLVKTGVIVGEKTAEKAVKQIMKRLNTMESFSSLGFGNNSADLEVAKNLVGLLYLLFAWTREDYSGHPTTTEDGPFFEMVQIGLGSIGYPAYDPKKLICEVIREKKSARVSEKKGVI